MSDRRIIWLSSYPKSGNTWVRAFLARYFVGTGPEIGLNTLRRFTSSDIRIDFYEQANGGSYQDVAIEDYLRLRKSAIALINRGRTGTHFVKTHHRIDTIQGHALIPPEFTAAAIYILRNPFDVAPSFARHNDISIDDAISAMMDPQRVAASPRGVYEILGRWDAHIESWTGAPGLPLMTLRYEDLHASPAKGFRSLFGFLKVKPDPARLARAIKATSFDALRKEEAREGFIERPAHMERFFHSGQAGGWRETLSDAQVARLFSEFEPAIRRWYPELVEDVMTIAGRAGA